MTYTKAGLEKVRDLCNEVVELLEDVMDEGDAVKRWDPQTGKIVPAPQWPYYGGTALTGTLKRRSMDLSRALIELRKP